MLLENLLLDFDRFTIYLLGIDHKLTEDNSQKAKFSDNFNPIQEVGMQSLSKSRGLSLNC